MNARKRCRSLAAAVSVLALIVAGCGNSESGGDGSITYAMWDTNQVPAYTECAEQFMQQHDDIKIKIEQYDYGDYWSRLNAGFVAGTAPDVFVNVTSFYPDFVTSDQLVDLTPLVEQDQVDLELYQDGTVDHWIMNDQVYGLPKDLDAIGIVVAPEAAKQAKIDSATLDKLTWNPKDGGSFGRMIKKLTKDSEGRDGLDPNFDSSKVETYGLGPSDTSPFGHSSWGSLALSIGGEFINKNPFGDQYSFDDPAVIETLEWYQTMVEDGYIMSPEKAGGLGPQALFEAKTVGATMAGSWMAGQFADSKTELEWHRLPKGDELKSFTNSIADSISASSDDQDAAWEWVKYLGSDECQQIVASHGVVIPSLKSASEAAVGAFRDNGVDLEPIMGEVLDPEARVSIPVSEHYGDVDAQMAPVIESILIGRAEPSTVLPEATRKVNELFE